MSGIDKLSLAFVGVALVGWAGFETAYQTQKETVTFTVTEKTNFRSGGKSSGDKYLLFTTKADGKEEVFENSDSFLRWKFNSSDVQGHLKDGQTYTAEAIGFRNNFWSIYRNVTNVKDVPVVSVPATPVP